MNDNNDQKNNIINLLLLMLTGVMAPLLSHFLDLCLGAETNTWKTDKLLLLYFSGVAGYIINNKLLREWSKTGFYKRGFKLGNSDALSNVIWMAPITIVIVCYESIIGASIIIVLIGLAIVILWRDIDKIIFTPRISLIVGLYVTFVTILFTLIPYEGTENEWIIFLVGIFISQLFVCLLFDLITIIQIKIHRDNGRKR